MQNNRIKLVEMVTNFHIGGTERQVANLALRIDSSRFDLHLACLRNSGELLRELESLDVPRPEFQIGPLYALRTSWQGIQFARYVRKNLIQIVHSYGFYPNIFAIVATRLAGKSLVIASIRDMGDGLTPVQARVQKFVCQWADCVLVNAEAIRERLIARGYNPAKIVVIRNGITLSRFEKKERSGLLRQELNLPSSARMVLVFCRLNQLKGVQYFLDAAALVADRFPDVHFVIAGDGANRNELEQHAAGMGLAQRMVFAGFRCDVPELLSEASISVLPSLSEGLSNSLLESMAAGVPVIAARVGGNPEVVEHEVTGILVPPRDSTALADAMGRLLEDHDLAVRFGQAGKRRVSEVFSVERSVGETENLYRNLLATGGRV